MALQTCAIQPMKTFLSEKYRIPSYQREYSWEKDEVSDFLRDLEETINDVNNFHFFGQVVVHNEEDKSKFIIDGQQRTTTSMIFLRTLQIFFADLYLRNPSNKTANKKSFAIDSLLGEYSDEEKSLHLTMNDPDNDYFIKEIIQAETPSSTKAKKKSCERMRVAFSMIFKHISEKLDSCVDDSEKVKLLSSYLDTFTENFKVMYMEATKLEEAFIIFETLNARGKDLETADLLKNYVFSKSSDINESQKKWNSMINKLDKVDPTSYIRHYWNSSRTFTREKGLYRAIVNNIKKPKDAEEFLEELEKYSLSYHDMCLPDECSEFSNKSLIQVLKNIKTLKARTFYPVILAMRQAKENYSETDICKVAQCIETYVFRNFTICGKVANSGELFLSDIALRIYEDLNSVDSICAAIKSGAVTDDEFKSIFSVWTSSNKEVIRYILRKINKKLDPPSEIDLNNSEVHIEHIMPVSNDKWGVSEDYHQDYLWKLGNLTLLNGKLNEDIGNDVFSKKVVEYRKSKIKLNELLCKDSDGNDRTTWNVPQDIIDRQNEFAELALEIWPK